MDVSILVPILNTLFRELLLLINRSNALITSSTYVNDLVCLPSFVIIISSFFKAFIIKLDTTLPTNLGP